LKNAYVKLKDRKRSLNGKKRPQHKNAYVKLKDRKRSLNGKKRPQHVMALEKQTQREILGCGSYNEESEGFGLQVTCNL